MFVLALLCLFFATKAGAIAPPSGPCTPYTRLVPYNTSIVAPVSNFTCCHQQQTLMIAFCDPRSSELSEAPLTQLLYYWGVLVFHDLSLPRRAAPASPDDCIADHAPLTTCPLVYDPAMIGNVATPALDASFIYGSTAATTNALRAHARGHMNVTAYGVLSRACDPAVVPKYAGPMGALDDMPCAGDPRAPETLQLLALQTLMVMEHNRHAERIASRDRSMSDDAVFAAAREIMVALVQKITLYEWLPRVLGARTPVPPFQRPRRGDPARPGAAALIEAMIALPGVWMSATNNRVLYSDQNQELVETPLATGFYNPAEMHAVLGGAEGVCSVLTGLLRDPLARVNVHFPAAFMDVGAPAETCAHEREGTVATYAQLAEALLGPGEAPVTLEDVTRDPVKLERVRALYVGMNDTEIVEIMSASVGMQIEDHGTDDDAIIGPVARALLRLQLVNYTRDRDPAWFEIDDDSRRMRGVEKLTLAEVLAENCVFIESFEAPGNEFMPWAVSDVKVVEENNSNLNGANLSVLITFAVIMGVLALIMIGYVGWILSGSARV